MFMKVDLPDPEGPITATNSPGSIASDTACRAGGVPGAAPKAGGTQSMGAGGGQAGGGVRGGGTGGGGARRDAGSRVYKLVDGKLTAVPVQVGVSDSTFTEIVGGEIKEGDKLVTRDLSGQGGPQSQLRLRMF